MQSLMVSMVRLSTAATLFGLEQIQTAAEVSLGRRGLSTAVDDLSNTFDSMATSLADKTAEEKKRTLESITRATKCVVNSSADAMAVMDPKRVVEATKAARLIAITIARCMPRKRGWIPPPQVISAVSAHC